MNDEISDAWDAGYDRGYENGRSDASYEFEDEIAGLRFALDAARTWLDRQVSDELNGLRAILGGK